MVSNDREVQVIWLFEHEPPSPSLYFDVVQDIERCPVFSEKHFELLEPAVAMTGACVVEERRLAFSIEDEKVRRAVFYGLVVNEEQRECQDGAPPFLWGVEYRSGLLQQGDIYASLVLLCSFLGHASSQVVFKNRRAVEGDCPVAIHEEAFVFDIAR